MNYIPFANTPSGDIVCIEIYSNKVELYIHELEIFEFICEDIEIFIKGLY